MQPVDASISFLAEPPASAEVTAVHDAVLAAGGYVPNYVRVWCWRPEVLDAFAKLRAELVDRSSLTAREVAIMVVATATARGDSYCALAWGKKLAALSDAETAADVVGGGDSALSAREASLLDWSRRVVGDPNATTEADVERLRQAGFSDLEIVEATIWIGLRLGFSTINDALGIRPDRELVEHVPGPVRAAVVFGREA